MAGGTFISMNKTRAGAYINFKGVPKPLTALGTRGIMTMPVAMDWGGTITELYSRDLIDGKSVPKIGYSAFDDESQIYREALKNCYMAVIYRLDTGGKKASAVLDNLTITAKYAGIVGNDIEIVVAENDIDDTKFDIITLYKAIEKNRQIVTKAEDLISNDWVDFSGNGSLSLTAGLPLTSGENGVISESAYTDYLSEIKKRVDWAVMAIPADVTAIGQNFVQFVKQCREDEGRKIQCVLNNYPADYEGIISTLNQGYTTISEVIDPITFVAYAAGLEAGAAVNESKTYWAVESAASIINPLEHDDIVKALKSGKFVLSTRQDGVIVCEQDINSLHTFTPEHGYAFSKNRVIRVLDEIHNSVRLVFEKSYIGKVSNNERGRVMFKADIIRYMQMLQGIEAIQDFDSTADIQIYQGDDIDAVVVDLAVMPVDSMEKLYMQVTVRDDIRN